MKCSDPIDFICCVCGDRFKQLKEYAEHCNWHVAIKSFYEARYGR
jgi:uncharacterized C2H2 Zn-finger protein